MILIDFPSGSFGVYEWDAPNNIYIETVYTTSAPEINATYGTFLGDIDADGDPDMVIGTNGNAAGDDVHITVFENDGTGSMTEVAIVI